MVNCVDPDQTTRAGCSGSALFAHAILLAILVYKILGHLLYRKWKVKVIGQRLILLVIALAGGICDTLVTLSNFHVNYL